MPPQDFVLLATTPQSTTPNDHSPSTDPKKRHACPTCSRAFTTSGHLARHIRVHTGERNHKCPFPGCETRCSRQDNLQQHYRIHLSPGSRRSASTRARGEIKKKTSSVASYAATNPLRSSLHSDEPPDSPPPLERATILPPLSDANSPPMNRASYRLRPDMSRPHSSPSGSSAGSPHSSYASVSPDIPNGGHAASPAAVTTNGSPFNHHVALSHQRTHSPAANAYPYPSFYQRPESSYSVPHAGTGSSSSYASSSLSTSNTLPPIHALEQHASSAAASTFMSGLGLGRIAQHPGPYPSYETAPSGQWHAPHTLTEPYAHPNQTWWANNTSNLGVVGAQRGYAQTYGS